MADHQDLGSDFSTFRSRDPAPGRLALVEEFVNTRNGLRGDDLFLDPDGVADWLAARGLVARGRRLDEDGACRAREVREAIRRLLADNAEIAVATRLEPLDAAASAAAFSLRFAGARGAALVPTADGLDGALGAILAAVHEAALVGTWRRLKVCRRPGCCWAFYDGTRNASGVWCALFPCGNRAKTRAYRQRLRGRG